MAFELEPRETKTCPHCGATMDDVTVGWRCPFCKTFINMKGRVYLHNSNEPQRVSNAANALTNALTNADRIRTMSDEELAELIAREFVRVPKAGLELAVPAWLRWLRAPVKED